MKNEIRSATFFLSDLLRLGHSLTDHQLDTFRGTLETLLSKHYHHHWFPERPTRGSGYRCIRINHKMDPLIAQAAISCGVNDSSLLRNMFPNELTMWIDPLEVSYRIGENGSICVIYDGVLKSSSSPPSSPTTTNNNNNNNSHNMASNRNSSSPNNNNNHRTQQQHNGHPNFQKNGMLLMSNGGPMMGGQVGGGSNGFYDRLSTCKESVRGMVIDNRSMNAVDQFAPYVSS